MSGEYIDYGWPFGFANHVAVTGVLCCLFLMFLYIIYTNGKDMF